MGNQVAHSRGLGSSGGAAYAPSDLSTHAVGAEGGSITGSLIMDVRVFYTFGKELGKGHFGSVYLAENKQHKYPAAVKVLRKRCLNTATVSTLKQEIELLMKVKGHPNIVEMFECLEDRSNLYIAMECCTGGELFDAIVSQPQYKFEDEKHVAQVMLDCFCAVEYCHNLGVVHRDLKPENLILSTPAVVGTNDYPTIKVIDFGLSRCYEDGAFMQKAVGTPYYIAPEVVKRHYGKECDVWSLGVILYVLLCGQPPFFHDSDQEIYRMLKSGKPHAYPDAEWKHISAAAKDLIDRCLRHNPHERITAKAALEHPFLKRNVGNLTDVAAPLATSFTQQMQQFQHGNRFQKIAKLKIAESMKQSEIKELHNLFKTLDIDGNGTLSANEVRQGVAKSLRGRRTSAADILETMDLYGDGVIHYDEFIAASMTKKQWASIEHLHYAFEKFDTSGSGTLTRQEVMDVLGGTDTHLCNELFEKFDMDHDGEISYEEFEQMMLAD
jgi:calcium-dependent protein kinase